MAGPVGIVFSTDLARKRDETRTMQGVGTYK